MEARQINAIDPYDALITKAKDFFNSSVLNTATSSEGNLDARQRLKKTALWDKAYISVTAKQEVVAVPLKYERPMKFKTNISEFNLKDQAKLLIFKGADGKLKAEVLTYIPSENNPQDQISGIIMVEDWAGNRINRYMNQKGKLYRLVDNRSTNLASAQSQCVKIDWYLCDVSDSGLPFNCQYMYSQYIGSCNEGFEPQTDGGTTEVYTEIEKRKRMDWSVYYVGSTWVTAWDVLLGKSGVFSAVLPKGSEISWSSPYTWHQDSHEVGYTGSVAHANVIGSFFDPWGDYAFSTEKQKIS